MNEARGSGGLAQADEDPTSAEELPIRLAHRVKELDALPNNLNRMPSIEKVKKWYAESFEVSCSVPSYQIPPYTNTHLYLHRNWSTSLAQNCLRRFTRLSRGRLRTLLLCPKLRLIHPCPST